MIQMARGAAVRPLTRSSIVSTTVGTGGGKLGGGFLREVEADDFVTGAAEAFGHVAAHFS